MTKKQTTPSLPQTVEKKQIRISPTGNGWLFMAVVSAILLGSINYNNNLGFLLSFLLGGMATVSILHGYKNLSGIKILSITGKPVFAGETAGFEVQVQTGLSPRRGIRIQLPDQAEKTLNIPDLKPERILVPARTEARGIFLAGALLVSTQYPLGLFRCVAKLPSDIHCLVYPKPISGPVGKSSLPIPSGKNNQEKIHPGTDDFQGLQSYRPGDPLQHIYWKTFAREQGLYLKSFGEASGDAVMLDLDATAGPDLEYRLSRLCHMILKASRMDILFGLKLPDRTISPDRGGAHRQACLKALALYKTVPKDR